MIASLFPGILIEPSFRFVGNEILRCPRARVAERHVRIFVANPRHPRFQDILAAELTSVVAHLRTAATAFGAQAVSHIRFQEPSNPQAGQLGRLTAHLVQVKPVGPDGPAAAGDKMSATQPYKDYKKHALPDCLLEVPVEYEILLERVM